MFAMQEQPLALVVNAGGQSARMGRDKALLPMPHTGLPLVVSIIRRLLPLVTDRVVVVTNDPGVAAVVDHMDGVLVVPDLWVGGGALGGVATGLTQCRAWAMVVACDMPLVDPAIFAMLVDVTRGQARLDAVIPSVRRQTQPFHGLWHRRALPKLVTQIKSGELGVQAALASLDVAWIDERDMGIESDSHAFLNINTPEEWAEVQAILIEQ